MKYTIVLENVQVTESVSIEFKSKECPGVIVKMEFWKGQVSTNCVLKKGDKEREFADWVRENTSQLITYFKEECAETKMVFLFAHE